MTTTQQTTDFSEYGAAFRRRRRVMVMLAFPAFMVAAAFALGLPNVYRSSAFIKFEAGEISGELQTGANANLSFAERRYADEYVVGLTNLVFRGDNTRGVLKEVELKAGEDPEAFVGNLFANTKAQTVRSEILDPDSGREKDIITGFAVSYDSDDPRRAVQVATWLSKAYIGASRQILEQRAGAAAQFFEAEADRYRINITDLEAKLADFRAQNYTSLPDSATANIGAIDRAERDLETAQLQIRTLTQNRIFLVQQLEQARGEAPEVGVLEALEREFVEKSAIYDPNHPDIVALRRKIDSIKTRGPAPANMTLQEQLAAQQADLAAVRQRYSDDHPDVKRIMRNVEQLQARIARGERAPAPPASPIATQLRTQMAAIDNEVAGLQARVVELRGRLAQLETRAEKTPLVEREYQNLNRDLDLARKKYNEILDNQMDAELKKAAITSGRADELKLIQSPGMPDAPTSPKRVAILIIGLLASIVIAFGGAIIAEILDQNVRGSRDVRQALAVAPLAVIPEIRHASFQRRLVLRLGAYAGCVLIGSALLTFAIRSMA